MDSELLTTVPVQVTHIRGRQYLSKLLCDSRSLAPWYDMSLWYTPGAEGHVDYPAYDPAANGREASAGPPTETDE